jgi:predicted GNAT family acetyltransferase
MRKKVVKKRTKPRKPKKWSEEKISNSFIIMASDDNNYGDKSYNLVKKTKTNSVYKKVGHIELDNSRIQHSEIDSNLRGKGIGKWFYERVLLDNGKLINSPGSTSIQAKRVHKSLIKKYQHKIDIFGDMKGCSEGDIIYYPKLLKPKNGTKK